MIYGRGSNHQENGISSMPVKSPILINSIDRAFSPVVGKGQETVAELSGYPETVVCRAHK